VHHLKIAFLAFHDPVKPVNGSGVRIHNLIKLLASAHEVTVLVRSDNDRSYTYEGIKVVEISSKVDTTYPISISYLIRCYKELRKIGCDTIVAEEAINISHAFSLARLLKCRSIYDAHNVDSINYFNIARGKPHIWIFYYLMELLAAIAFDRISLVSDIDLNAYKKLFPLHRARLYVIPNGVDCERFVPKPTSAINTCLFFGSFLYAPNLEAFEQIQVLAAKLPTITFVIAGEGSERLQKEKKDKVDNLKILGKVADIVQTIQASNCVVVPLSQGSGTRLKILEAMACGKPVITTPKGAEGLDLKNGEEAIVCDLYSFNSNIMKLLQDDRMQESISKAARERAINEYDWKAIEAKLRAAFVP